MAENQKITVIIPEKTVVNTLDKILIKLLLICGELNYIFHAKRFGLDKGIVLVLDEEVSKARFLKNLQDICGAVMVSAPKKSCENMVWNYQLAVCEYNKYEKWENLKAFLDIKKFVPIIVTNGIVPDVLKDLAHIIEISAETCRYMETLEFRTEIDAMIKFVRANPDVVVRELDLLRTSEIFNKRNNDSPLFSNLLAALSVYSAFYRSSHTDKETAAVKAKAECEIQKSVQRAEELAEECDYADAIRKVINHYFSKKDDFRIFGVDEVDEIAIGQLRSGKAIVYDHEFYYIPEVLLKRACGSLMTTVSHIQIKRTLRDEGILMCNRTEHTNFTIKKVFVNRDGKSFRERVLKFDKEFFISREGLYLEEGRHNKACKLESQKRVPAALARTRKTSM